MKKFLKAVLYSLGVVLLGGLIYLGNLFLFKPFSLDHYLAKELILEMLDSPEAITYLGMFDRFNWAKITKEYENIIFKTIEKFNDANI